MSIKEVAVIVVFLIGIQMLVVAILTRLNGEFLNKYKATNYSKAMADLAKDKPKTVFAIRCCYAASLVELVILVLMKFSN